MNWSFFNSFRELYENCGSLENLEYTRILDMIVERPDDDQMLQIEFLYFISSLFGRTVNTHNDYKISAGFTNT